MVKKNKIFEEKYSDNFKPNFIEKLVIKYELPRAVAIAKLIKNKNGTLVDLACGDGDFLDKYGKSFDKLIGIDIAKNRINNAKNKFLHVKKAEFKCYDLENGIPLEDNSVDSVICEASLAYFRDSISFLKEVNRILKPKGEFIVQIGNYAALTRRISLLFGNLPKVSSFKGHDDGGMIRYFTFKTLKQLLLESNFNIENVSNSGLFSNFRKIYLPLLSSDIIYRAVKK